MTQRKLEMGKLLYEKLTYNIIGAAREVYSVQFCEIPW